MAFWKGMNMQHLEVNSVTIASGQGMAPSVDVASMIA